MHKYQQDAERAREVLKFFKWAYENGDQMALALDYIPMPENVSKMVQTYWKQSLSDSVANPIWK
jgi:phosphate transport system substrate-binding protein